MSQRLRGAGAKGNDDDVGGLSDRRMQWMEARIAMSLKFKHQEMKKFLESDDVRMAFSDFLDSVDTRHLFVTSNPPAVHTAPPESFRRKSMYFLKKPDVNERITPDNIARIVLYGELGPDPLETLAQLATDVFLPHVNNPTNLSHLAPSVAADVVDKFNGLVANLHVTMGVTNGRTVLPLPDLSTLERASKSAHRADLVHALDATVVAWTRQVKAVLAAEPEAVLAAQLAAEAPPGTAPRLAGPLDELDYWTLRVEDLQALTAQLNSPQVTQVRALLEEQSRPVQSQNNVGAFTKLLREVELARAEARDVVRHLGPMRTLLGMIAVGTPSTVPHDQLVSDGVFRKVFHLLFVTWKYSHHFKAPTRLVALIRELGNDVVYSAAAYAKGREIFKADPEDAVKRLSVILTAALEFKNAFFLYKLRIPREGTPQWDFPPAALFGRVDAFVTRCHFVLDVIETAQLFSRLEKIEIGGARGAELSATVRAVLDSFNAAYAKFPALTADDEAPDVLSIDEATFTAMFDAFKATVEDLERRLGAVVATALKDCRTVASAFKLVESFGDLLSRALIAQEWLARQHDVVALYHDDVKRVRDVFYALESDPPQQAALPPTASMLYWTRGLLLRIEEPQQQFAQHLARSVLETPAARDAQRLYVALSREIHAYAKSTYESWAARVGATLQDKLQCFVFRRVPATVTPQPIGDGPLPPIHVNKLVVNFDPVLSRMLSEVHYLRLYNQSDGREALPIPQPALTVFDQVDTYRRQVQTLEQIAAVYNTLLDVMLPVERPLVARELSQLEMALRRGLEELSWTDGGAVEEYARKTLSLVEALQGTITVLKDNVKDIAALFQTLLEQPRFLPPTAGRKDLSKALGPDALAKAYGAWHGAHSERAAAAGQQAAAYLQACWGALANITPHSEEWRAYVAYVHEIVLRGVETVVVSVLTDVRNQLDPEWLAANDGVPIIDVRLSLGATPAAVTAAAAAGVNAAREVIFAPALEADADADSTPADADQRLPTSSLDRMIGRLVLDAVLVADLIRRMDSLDAADGETTYFHDVANAPRVVELRDEINALRASAVDACVEFQQMFMPFSYLWLREPQRAFDEFLAPRRQRQAAAAYDDEDGTGGDKGAAGKDAPKDQQPVDPRADPFFGVKLDYFEERIVHYGDLQREIAELPESSTRCGWARLDAKPLKHALRVVAGQWKGTFTSYLRGKVEATLDEHVRFMDDVEAGLTTTFTGDEKRQRAQLCEVLGRIRACKMNNDAIVSSFEPIADVVAVLSRHTSVAASEAEEAREARLDTLRKTLPARWEALYKRSLEVREALSDRQEQQSKEVRKTGVEFNARADAFSRQFYEQAPFQYKDLVENAYAGLEQWHREMSVVEASAEQLRHFQVLFDLTATENRGLVETRADIHALKQLWDMIAHVHYSFEDWMRTPFKLVDVGVLLEEARKLQRQLKGFPARVRNWDVFRGCEADVRDMVTSLPLVQDLRSTAMRPRHWQHLLAKCSERREAIDPDSDGFTLARLIALGLHAHVDEVAVVVEKAAKELLIERALRKINDVWSKLELTYVRDPDHDVPLLGPTDEVMEILEEHTTQVQSMLSNRFIDHFQESASTWLAKLSAVDTILSKWLEVQKKWHNLYPIFVTSADIRQQLPEDAARFMQADVLFRSVMDKAQHVTSVLTACTSTTIARSLDRSLGHNMNLEALLDEMDATLSLCEKALADYLETKRLAFPRFYFVSAADLVDILSKGSDPRAVMVHVSKIIDSVDRFAFDSGRDSKEVTTMISREGEVVPLCRRVSCDGPVEQWLQTLIDVMQDTMRGIIGECNMALMDSARNQWILEWCAQAVVVVSRIQWTAEMTKAFQRLEEGNDGSLRAYLQELKKNLGLCIGMVMDKLTKEQRRKLITLITTEVHNRDIVQKLADDRVADASAFAWVSQLRFRWDDAKGCSIDICDASFVHGYEYIGNCGCLVITPLTDRCYITLTQSLRLCMGGAPAGPAGTGKTETTKDLARAIGRACYVFNCSDQMDYKSLGNIFKGLAMSGAWGCFDEFNRISIEVLSVVAVQVKSVLDAVRKYRVLETARDTSKLREFRFAFMGVDSVPLQPTVGMFITMNPGYKGRTELPENIKALFRPCAMIVPDIQSICEIMLAAEGFGESKDLAKKFVTLYNLNRELLSKQLHYDWGLRAVKSVLVIAGGLKRAEPTVDERKILLRALRDTNRAKLARDDVDVFMKLLQALFPNLDIAPKENAKLQTAVKQVCAAQTLQVGEGDIFVRKCLQLDELLYVRHSVFVLGPAGSGKSRAWQALAAARATANDDKVMTEVLNPKAISSNELYGFMHPQTRDWRDGLLSRIFRDLAQLSRTKTHSKWIVLDGDIDTEWIESMNTVMDDNKMLTLASNERIPLTESMRLLFEIGDLRNASLATVSRAGVLFFNESDLGWQCYKDSWIAKQADEKARGHLEILFEKFVPSCFEYLHKNAKQTIPISDISIVESICRIVECLLPSIPPGTPSEIYERYFVFALLWAFGGTLACGDDGTVDYRTPFSNWFKKEFSSLRLGDVPSVFDVHIDPATHDFAPWSAVVPKYTPQPDLISSQGLSAVNVATVDTTRLMYVTRLLSSSGFPVMLVGRAGTGKTSLVRERLAQLDTSEVISRTVNFNSSTGSQTFQDIVEGVLDKKGGRQFGPPGRKRCIFHLDDLNMPTPDKYGTQSAVALLRQHIDYGMWFDRVRLTAKDIVKVSWLASLNQKAGSFTVDPRLQRHFTTLTVSMPDRVDMKTIYLSILEPHFNRFSRDVKAVIDRVVDRTIELHRDVSKTFLPTAINFHYSFNLRDFTNIFQGLLLSDPARFDVTSVIQLWVHECNRTFGDRLVDESDVARYTDLVTEKIRSGFSDIASTDALLPSPLVFMPQQTQQADIVYERVETYADLDHYVSARLNEYNIDNASMELVLFNQALEHVARVARILMRPRGSALLVGVGGSGKQSLARLAAFSVGLEITSLSVSSSYSYNDFKTDIQNLYVKAGSKGFKMALVLNDSHILEDRFLVLLNDMLSSGVVPDLFAPEDREQVESSVVNLVKQRAYGDPNDRDVLWSFFIDQVRANLHVVLCLSPVGKEFRDWCRRFPALHTCTSLNWFFPWPHQALVSVAERFLSEISFDNGDDAAEHMAEHMAFVHQSVDDASRVLLLNERFHNYTTPKSFLELISLFKRLLGQRRAYFQDQRRRFTEGLLKLKTASSQVADLKGVLEEEQQVVGEQADENKELMAAVAGERALVKEKAEKASEEEKKALELMKTVNAIEQECRVELERARPIVEAALAALDTLNKANLTELKVMPTPPADVAAVVGAVVVLTQTTGNHPPRDRSWAAAKRMMGNVSAWLKDLQNFDKDNIPPAAISEIEPLLETEAFNPVLIERKSVAAAGLCKWVLGMVKFYYIRCDVRPKELRLAQAQEDLRRAQSEMKAAQDMVTAMEDKLQVVVDRFNAANADRMRIEGRAASTQQRLNLAERLVNGLAEENVRWGEEVRTIDSKVPYIVGDCMLAASFIAYLGPFGKAQRTELLDALWRKDLVSRGVLLSDDPDLCMRLLTDDAEVARWTNEGLPPDRVSIENGAIVTNCDRWPLLVDPQLQGARWIKTREAQRGLVVVQANQDSYLPRVLACIEEGTPVLIENLSDTVDPLLNPILARQFFNRQGHPHLHVGDTWYRVHPEFRLYLQTKLAAPHFRPEVVAQTTMVQMAVTEAGLQDQLLSIVVKTERPELEEMRANLLHGVNTMKIELRRCEDSLLYELTNAQGDPLENTALIESLEESKRKATLIKEQMVEAAVTNKKIDVSRSAYKDAAERAALLFFSINKLHMINHMYQYSLQAFTTVFNKALRLAARSTDLATRVRNIVDTITITVFQFTARGLFEQHKLILSSVVTFAILSRDGNIHPDQHSFLLRCPKKIGVERPADGVGQWLGESNWAALNALAQVDGATPSFENLPADVNDGKRWRDWAAHPAPEGEKMPMEWKGLTPFQRLLVLRCLRPDRMTAALEHFVGVSLGASFTDDVPRAMTDVFPDSSPTSPLFFILSPGTDPTEAVEAHGRRLGFVPGFVPPPPSPDGRRRGGALYNVSLGQGQEPVAEEALEASFREGGWVVLNNIHLTAKWLPRLEKILDGYAAVFAKQLAALQRVAEIRAARKRAESANAKKHRASAGEAATAAAAAATAADPDHAAAADADAEAEAAPVTALPDGAAGIAGEAEAEAEGEGDDDAGPHLPTAEELLAAAGDDDYDDPDLDPQYRLGSLQRGHPNFRVFLTAEPAGHIPIGILQRSVKITNEPPRGLKANLLRAMRCFSDETWDASSKASEMKQLIFGLCFFHSVIVERKKFGPQGWNRQYPFNLGDLITCSNVLANYLEDKPRVPFEDLRYVFGEIMYGGHITDDLDRTLCLTYLHEYIRPEVLEGADLAQGFAMPMPLSHAQYIDYIQGLNVTDSPQLYGLHPNSEINFRTTAGDQLFKTLLEMAPNMSSGGGESSEGDKVRAALDEMLSLVPEPHNIVEVNERLEDDRGPFQNVFYQECARMNALLDVVTADLRDLDLGLKGALAMTAHMSEIQRCVFLDQVPETWGPPVGFMTARSLGSWLQNLLERNQQLSDWVVDLQTPRCVWLPGFFNPTAFLTAILQSIALTNNYDLDQMVLTTEVLKKTSDQIEAGAREGAYVHGLYLEGARWDNNTASLEDERPKELYPPLPVLLMRGLPAAKVDLHDYYACPVYKTVHRGPGFVVTAHLKTRHPARKWIIGGVAILMDIMSN